MVDSDGITALPKRLEDIDAEFVTRALSRRFPETRIAAVEIADLRQGSASSLRLRMEYVDNPHRLPPSTSRAPTSPESTTTVRRS